MKNSIRLILAALVISGVTYAAAGAPAPSSSTSAQAEPAPPPVSFAHFEP